MKHISSSSNPTAAQTLSAYRDTSKNIEKSQTESTAGGTSSNRSDVTVSRQAYSQAKFDSYETMDRNALKKTGRALLNQLDIAGTKKANEEVPDSDDPQRLARAKQATEFCQRRSDIQKNPFLNLPREELTKIIYDDTGTYTINERSAALSEQGRQDYNYWNPIIEDAFMSRDYRKHYRAAIEFYDKLSPIEQSFAPGGYRENLVGWLEEEEQKLGKLDKSDNTSLPPNLINSAPSTQKSKHELLNVYSWLNTQPKVLEVSNSLETVPGGNTDESIFRVTWNNVAGNVKKFFQ